MSSSQTQYLYVNCPFCNHWVMVYKIADRKAKGPLCKVQTFHGRANVEWGDFEVDEVDFEELCNFFIDKGKEIVRYFKNALDWDEYNMEESENEEDEFTE